MSTSNNGLPPLNALKVFDAVARLGSMNRAATELRVAPSSVTQHIRNLEDFVGADLFDRSANAAVLNARGRAYADRVRTAFDLVQAATGDVVEAVDRDPVRISCVPTLATAWLARLLAETEAAFPGTAIRCDFSPVPVDFEGDEVDLAIRYGPGTYPGAVSEFLFRDEVAPVCAPETATRIREAGDLTEATRLESAETAPDGRSIWAYWAAAALGEAFAGKLDGSAGWSVASSQFAIEVLRTSATVAVLERSVVGDLLDSGDLVAPLGGWVPAPYGYHVLSSSRRPLKPAAKHLKALLKQDVQQHFGAAYPS